MPLVPLSIGDLLTHRLALTAPDSPNTPAMWASYQWVQNGGIYTRAKVSVKGISWAPSDTGLFLTFRLWRKEIDGPERGGTFTVQAVAKGDALLTDVGSVAYQIDSVVDDGQDFDLYKPVGPGDPSLYAILAEPASTSDPAFIAWAYSGGIPTALNVRTTHFADVEGSEGANQGWAGGLTPDGSVTQYELFTPNVNWSNVFDGLDGDDLAITLESVSGTGQYLLDVGVVLS